MAKSKQPQRQIKIEASSTLLSATLVVPENKAEKVLTDIRENYLSQVAKNVHNSKQLDFTGTPPSECEPLKVKTSVL